MAISDVSPVPQLLSRWWLLFFGFILVVFGITGLLAAQNYEAAQTTEQGVVTTSIIMLITALITLWVGFRVRNARTVRMTAGIIAGLYLLWGIVYLLSGPQTATDLQASMMSSTGGLFVLLGALGLAASLVPANYLYEQGRTMAT